MDSGYIFIFFSMETHKLLVNWPVTFFPKSSNPHLERLLLDFEIKLKTIFVKKKDFFPHILID